MASIFRIRRGSASTMSGVKSNIVLAAGELFAEYPDEGPGTGAGRFFLGDGSSPFSELHPFLEPTDLSTETVEVVANSKTTSAAALNDVVSNNTIGSLVGSLKQAISLTKSELTSSINDLTVWKNSLGTVQNDVVPFKLAIDSSGNYGYKKAGADTVTPFKTSTVHNGLYTATSRGDLDMGVDHSYRWVRTTSVPNNNTGTYTVPYHSTGLDMGANNTYRWVNTTNAYNQGYNDGNSNGYNNGYNTGYNAAKFISKVNLKNSNEGIGASVTWYGWPGIYYFYGHTKSSGGDASISSVANGTLIANNVIRNDGIFSDMAIIRANAEGNVTVYLRNNGTGFVTVYEIVIG